MLGDINVPARIVGKSSHRLPVHDCDGAIVGLYDRRGLNTSEVQAAGEE